VDILLRSQHRDPSGTVSCPQWISDNADRAQARGWGPSMFTNEYAARVYADLESHAPGEAEFL